ncbi:MAG: aminodeoxychorismate/anthranilate synthase component II [Planctomycetes bacterium]|nr:aminodeoxychorismate/anthranilate synthase component II [Planctomycetota bacterium]
MRTVLLDNRDSFVWNLAQLAMGLGASVDVVRSDRAGVAEVLALRPDAILISPGPGRPEDAGCSPDVVRELGPRIPILGVCLGHQAIGLVFGGSITRCPPCHGKTRAVEHAGNGLFVELPARFDVCRYHSLCVARDAVPDELVVDAWSDDGVVMALRHARHRIFGLQFHPESFLTPHGGALVKRFFELAA